MAVITISRQLGSYGSAIAERIAETLNYRLYDRELIRRVAEYARVHETSAERVDERHLGSVHSTLSSLAHALEGPRITEECYQIVIGDLIREIAKIGNAVIVGRAAQCILRSYEPAFHVHVIAPYKTRVERIARREGIDYSVAALRVRESDEQRCAFTRAVGRCDWSDPSLYDLVVNTELLSAEDAAEVILTSIRRSNLLGPAMVGAR